MAANLEKLAEYYKTKGNTSRAGFYLGLVAEERAKGTPETFSEVKSPDLLTESITEYNSKFHTPELITEHWRILWKSWGEKVDLSLDIPPCDRTAKEIKRLEQEGKKLIYVPPQLSTQESRYLLGAISPKMRSYSTERNNPVENDGDVSGWLDVEAFIDSPNTGTTEDQLRQLFRSQKREGLDLSEYIIGSQHAKLTQGKYFDESATFSRLLGSRYGNQVVRASFHSDGRLGVTWALPQLACSPSIGGRSRGVKKA